MIAFERVTLTTASSIFELNVYPNLTDKYILTGASGFGPMPIVVNTTPSTDPGAIYSGTQIQEREMVLTFRLNPDWGIQETAQQLRTRMYNLMSGGKSNYVDVTVSDDRGKAHSTGYVSLIDIATYTRTPEIQITIKAPNPMFIAEDYDEYPATERQIGDLWVYDAIIDNTDAAVTGFTTIANMQSHEEIAFEVSSELSDELHVVGPPVPDTAEDTFTIETHPGSRDVTSLRHGNFIGFLTPDSKWPMVSSTMEKVIFSSSTRAHAVRFRSRKQWWGF